MFNIFRYLFMPMLLCLLTLSCSDDEEDLDEPTPGTHPLAKGRRTVIMYVSAQNSLGEDNFHKQDSIEISKGHHFINDEDRLIVYMDDENNPRMYRYTKEEAKPTLIRSWKEDVNSSSPLTLIDVLSWTKDHYPAKEYGLVMWSHSDGWIPATSTTYQSNHRYSTFSFGIDNGVQMDIYDMAKAIYASGIHLKYIFFDSCLMQNLEVCYTLRHVTDYVIGAPIMIPGCGANYTHMLEKGLFTTAEYDIVDTYSTDATNGYAKYGDEYYDYGLVISSIRTDKLEPLARTTAEVLSSIPGNRPDFNMNGVLNYQNYTSDFYYRPHNYDAQEAMRSILHEEAFHKFQKVLNEAIVCKGATEEFWIGPNFFKKQSVDLQNYSGISMFIPQDIYSSYSKLCIFGDLNKRFQETEWYKDAGWEMTGW